MNTNDWEMLGQHARKISAPTGDPEATSFLNLFRLLVMLAEIRNRDVNPTDPSARVVIEFKDSGPLPFSIHFSDPNSIESVLVSAFRHREEWNKNHPEAQVPLFGLTPELRAWWALQRQYNEEEIAADLRELREKGGPELAEVIQELEQELVTT